MRIFIVAKEVRENGMIVKQKIRGVTDSETVLNFSQDNLDYIYDDNNLSVYELQLSNYDSKKVTGFNSMDQIKKYIASCATHSIKAPFNFYKSYITEVKCIYYACGINRFLMDTGFTFKYKGISFFLYKHFEKNTDLRPTHYITAIKEEQ